MSKSIHEAMKEVIAETATMSDSELNAKFQAAKEGVVGRAITEGREFLSDQVESKTQRTIEVLGFAFEATIIKGIFSGELCFESSVKEFPDLVDYGDTEEESLGLIKDSIVTTLTIDCIGVDNKKHVCLPSSDKCLCGVTVRRKSLYNKQGARLFSCYECCY